MIFEESGKKAVLHARRKFDTAVILYTFFHILRKMKHQLGLEAMLEYLEEYPSLMENQEPLLENYLRNVIININVRRIYRDYKKMRRTYEP